MSEIKTKLLNLFGDNITSDITPKDMRTLIENIFESKENNTRKITDITAMVFAEFPIMMNDLVLVDEEENTNRMNGLYISRKDYPLIGDLDLVASITDINNILSQGQDNEILSIKDGELVWIPQKHGYYIKGTKPIDEILVIVPLNIGEIFIAEDTQPYAQVPGVQGDGYSWSGTTWINIGKLVGEDGTGTGTGTSEPSLITQNMNVLTEDFVIGDGFSGVVTSGFRID